MSAIIYVEGTVIKGGKDEIRIYIKKKYWKKLKPYIGKTVKMFIIIENDSP